MTKEHSFPKHKIKVLLLEGVHTIGEEIFSNDGFDVVRKLDAMNEEELCQNIKDVHIIGIRSKTHITQKVLENAPKLLAIGAFCIGTNQIDLKTCSTRGVAVFNAPYSNTRSVVELAIGEIVMLMRNIFPRSNEIHKGEWKKSAKNSFEVRGKTIGIIGYGHIGSQLSVVSEAMGLKVLYYDIVDKMPMGNAQCCKDIDELLAKSDIVTLHIDGRKENDNFMNKDKFTKMKDSSYFLNLARGKVVDYSALGAALKSSKILGAGLDVYPTEPKSNDETFSFELQNIPNVILTPHIGGSTEEAQKAIGTFVPHKLLQYINNGSTDGSVNMPIVQLPVQKDHHRILHIHQNKSGILAKINSIIATHQVNITGQYLKTTEELGYVIIDIDGDYPDKFVDELKKLENTLKCRLLY